MKKVFVAAALAAMIVSCGSEGNKSAEIYEGILPAADAEGINYQLTLRKTGSNSPDTYHLTTTYLGIKNGNRTFTDKGTVVTLVGIPDDSTALVYQLVSAGPENEKTNFLAEGDSALTMIGEDFKKAASKLNYTLKKKR